MKKLTLTLMCGLARSGKSTWIKRHGKDSVVVCPDRVRKLIFGHQFHGGAEDFVWATAKAMAKLLLEQGRNVLVDATNLNYEVRLDWYRIANDYNAKIRIVWVKTSLVECKQRNAKSPKDERLPEVVLDRMACRFENPVEDYADPQYKKIEVIETPYKGKWGKSGNIYREEALAGVKIG